MKKMLLMAVAFLMTTAMNAQNAEKGFSYAAEVGIGSELELGVRAQYNFNKYFALDLPVLKYARDYGSHPFNEITIQAGVRGFSPTFGPDLKAFAALDMGYGNMFKGGGTSLPSTSRWASTCGKDCMSAMATAGCTTMELIATTCCA